MIPHWWMLGGAILTGLAGQTLLKGGSGAEDFVHQLFDWRTLVGLGLYGGAALLYIFSLRRIPMSVALPINAASYIAAALIGHFGFQEPLGLMHGFALALIAVGVVMLAMA